jgi:hypothetical protein
MNTLKFIAIGALVAVTLPLTSHAKSSAVERYTQVKGPFATVEEAETACMRAVGFNNESIRLYTGNIGNLWKVENPLRFLVRRCLNNVKKQEENRIRGERRVGRKAKRIEREIVPKTRLQILQNRNRLRDRTYNSVRLRAGQHTRTSREQTSSYINIRSQERVRVRAQERALREKLDKKKKFQEEANEECKRQKGAQRVMCIRREVREREEALYNE